MQIENKVEKQSSHISLLAIQIETFEDFLVFKTMVNELNISKSIHIVKKRPTSSSIFYPISILIQYSSFQDQLYYFCKNKLEDAYIRNYLLDIMQKPDCWSMEEFDQIVFGGTKWSLLRTNYCRFHSQLNNLFSDSSVFKIMQIKKGNLENDNSKHYTIQCTNAKLSEQIYQTSALIKLNNRVVINFSKIRKEFISNEDIYQKEYNFLRQAEEFFNQLFIRYQESKRNVFLQMDYYAQTYIQIQFNEPQHLYDFTKNIYSMGLQQSLQWNFDSSRSFNYFLADINGKMLYEIKKRMLTINKQLRYSEQNQWTHNILQTSYLQPQSEGAQVINGELQLLTYKMAEKDLLSVQKYWPSICHTFDTYLQNWDLKNYGIKDKVYQNLIKMIHKKIQIFKLKNLNPNEQIKYFSLAEQILPNIQIYLSQFMRRLKLTRQDLQQIKLPQIYDKKQPILDQLLKDYIQQLQMLKNGQGQILIKIQGMQQKSLKDFFPQVLSIDREIALWEDVRNIVTLNIKNVAKSIDKNLITSKQFHQQIQYEELPSNRCLGCTQFFYLSTNVIRGNNTVKIIPFASKIKDYQSTIKESICEMLNNNGGIILFNCLKQYGSIIPNGSLLTQKDKEGYQNQIINLLSSIYPKPQLSKNIFISFVPVMKNPFTINEFDRKLLSYTGTDQHIKKNQQYYEFMNIQGLYVTRVKVCPTHTSTVYVWSSEDSIYHLSGFDKKDQKRLIMIEQKKPLPISSLRKVIKTKFRKYLKTSKQMYRSRTFGNPLAHSCPNPNSGVKIRQKQQIINPIPLNGSLQDSFKHVSMIVVKHKYLSIVQQRLTSRGIQCQYQIKFQARKFKTASSTAILYHNQRFEQVLHKISYRTQFQFEGKPVLVISVTDYLKLQEFNEHFQMKQQELINAELWLRQQFPKDQFPNEELKFYQLRRGRTKEYYLRTGSKVSTLFMYYLLNGYKRRAVFKNPPNLDRMTAQQRQQLFIQIPFRTHNGNIRRQSMQVEIPYLNRTMLSNSPNSVNKI